MWLGCILCSLLLQGCSPDRPAHKEVQPESLQTLLALTPDKLAKEDIARMNLLCAQGLPGCDQVDVPGALAVLDAWAARVKSETGRHVQRFERNPAEFEHSRGFFKMLMLGVVLAEDFKVHYRADKRSSPVIGGSLHIIQ